MDNEIFQNWWKPPKNKEIYEFQINNCGCSGKAKLIHDWDYAGRYRIICEKCGFYSPDYYSKEEAVKKWNKVMIK